MKNILVTGCAGFIGFHLVNNLLLDDYKIIGIDSINDYYDVDLKLDRLSLLGIRVDLNSNKFEYHSENFSNLKFFKFDLSDKVLLFDTLKDYEFDLTIHLAAQAGVRYSFENPDSYISNNIIAFYNILEYCTKFKVKKLLYASSSSVYGNNSNFPYIENLNTDKPVSLYAATKKIDEILAYTYCINHDLQVLGLRFFTVYGPYGRPDMAYFNFTKFIIEGRSINVFNQGELERDFTYIDDVIISIKKIILKIHSESYVNKYDILNIGNSSPVKLIDFINTIENALNMKARMNMIDMQRGDVLITYANVDKLLDLIGYQPVTKLNVGIIEFVKWFKEYYKR